MSCGFATFLSDRLPPHEPPRSLRVMNAGPGCALPPLAKGISSSTVTCTSAKSKVSSPSRRELLDGGQLCLSGSPCPLHRRQLLAQDCGNPPLLCKVWNEEGEPCQHLLIDRGDPGCLLGVRKEVGFAVGRRDLCGNELRTK